ncbi:MAG: site-specific integrase [Rhodobacteraceae bacterium]|nr:site-specific integrase [Paracoccaceae bacterium]
MTTLNAAIKYALATRRITYAPIVTLPKKGVAKDRWLTEDEVQRLLEVSVPHVQRFIKIALYTGRRKTAITRLKWLPSQDSGWVDLDTGVIHFRGKAEAETKKRKGIVKMPSKLHAEMKTWTQEGSYVVSFKGAPIKRIDKAFRAAVNRANLLDVTPHTLKHTAVTWAFKRGMTLEDATAYFATSRETLEEVYRSYSPDAQKNAAEIMNWKL